MIGFGSKGDDGIEEGIHLRWSFNDKLGFPPCFKLYRRESDPKNKYEFPIQNDIIPQKLDLPYTYEVRQNQKFKFKLAKATSDGKKASTLKTKNETLENGTAIRYILIEGELTILFSKPVSRIELKFLLEDNSAFKIKALSEDGNYHPYNIEDPVSGLQNISFDAPGTNGLILMGTVIKLVHLAGWICVAKGNWERINDYCGCGLPVNQEGTNYVNDVYPPIIGRDLATALCRLGYGNVANSPITILEFLELKAMLLTITHEGSEVPVGWTLFPGDEGEGTTETLEFSKYDFLLAQSLHVFFAKILDLYFVDTDTENNKVYDYKVTAEWPEWNLRRLDHQITFDAYQPDETFFPVLPLDDQVVLYAPKRPRIVDEIDSLSGTALGLDISSEKVPIIISFLQPVTEVHIFMVNPDFTPGDQITIEAYKHLFSSWVSREELVLERGMLRLRAAQIDYIKIHTSHAVLCRIHYDFEPFPVGLQNYILCGIFKHTHLPLTRPTNLVASFLPGGTVTDQDGNVTEKPYLAGLRWDVDENPHNELISLAPVLYHMERKTEAGDEELITEDSPLFVTPSYLGKGDRDIPIGWPEERQYFTEAITRDTYNNYRIAGLDLFGRQSTFTEYETYEIKEPKPPHPLDVSAQFLDYDTYNVADNSCSDPTITDIDKTWLSANARNAIVVRWKWPQNLQLQAPDVEGFDVHFKQGWLNSYTGIVMTEPEEEILTKTSLNLTVKELEKYVIFDGLSENIPVYNFQISLDVYPGPLPEPQHLTRGISERALLPEDAFRLCWLTQGNHSFLILKNDGGPPVSLWILKLEDMPVKDKGYGVAVTPEKDFFIDYKDPGHWYDNRITHQEPKDSREEYVVYIEDPEFPNPTLKATDINKVRYAQIGVNSYVGEIKGSVSAPATIMALYREVPPAPIAFIPEEDQVEALLATPANIYGKSSFALRWNKSTAPVKYQVLRTLDQTLFKSDFTLRPSRSSDFYDTFGNDHPYFPAVDVAVVEEVSQAGGMNEVLEEYRGLTPLQLQILASLPDNMDAFTRINDANIDPGDEQYADRMTEIPDPDQPAYIPADDMLLYIDKTLNGQSNNYYFYAIRTVDTNGLTSALSISTLPIAIPRTTPPPVPVITAVNGGENKVILKWAKNPGAEIAGYLVYRTHDKKNARDWRKMELIKANDTDVFSVAVNGSLPSKEFEFVDESAIARQAYYYGIVAVGLSDEGKWLPSRISQAVVGQGFDLTPPEPPEWIIAEWISDANGQAIHLVWRASEEMMYSTLQRRPLGGGVWTSVSQRITASSSPFEFEFIDRTVIPGNSYDYRILGEDQVGNKNLLFNIQPVRP